MLDFIYNPHAGNGKTIKYITSLTSKLDSLNIAYNLHKTEYKNHAKQIANELTSSGAQNIISVGGDGTLHEVINGLADPSNVTLGLIPCGSGNDFAASLSVPLNPEKALDIIIGGNSKYIDYMECSGVRGINVIGTGVDVEILKRCYSNKFLKGKFKYAIETVRSVFSYKCKHIDANTDNKNVDGKSFIVAACNGRYFGGSMPIAPNANISDGLLEFILVKDMPLIKKPGALFHLATGKINRHYMSICDSTKNINAIFDSPVSVEIDGEIYENLEFNVSVVHDKLKFFSL